MTLTKHGKRKCSLLEQPSQNVKTLFFANCEANFDNKFYSVF